MLLNWIMYGRALMICYLHITRFDMSCIYIHVYTYIVRVFSTLSCDIRFAIDNQEIMKCLNIDLSTV